MRVACVDLEGVLIPELWPCLASMTGQSELSLTTREVPDYPRLVARRIDILRSCGLRLNDVRQLLEDIRPLPGAVEFLEALGQEFRIVLVSDAFEQMVQAPWARLGCPELRCHRFQCDAEGYVVRPSWRRSRGKHEEVEALAGAGSWVFAIGDAFNDVSMLRAADLGVLFRPSMQTAAAAKDIACAHSYDELLEILGTAGVWR